MNKNFKTVRITVDAMLAAMCAVLGYIAFETNFFKLTFEDLPVILGALICGPVDGMIVGGIGTFVYQILKYGFDMTTILWILPYIIYGLILGIYAKVEKFNYDKNIASRIRLIVVMIISNLVVTGLNTAVMYIDSKLKYYYFPGFITSTLAMRIGVSVAKAIVYAVVVPELLKVLKKTFGNVFRKSDSEEVADRKVNLANKVQ